MKTVVGLLNSRNEAQEVVEDLVNCGFQRNAINVMATEEGQGSGYSEEGEMSAPGTKFGEAGTGMGAGRSFGLTRLGVPESDADYYAEGIRRGGFLVTCSADDDNAEEAADVMRRHGAIDIDERAQSWRQEGWAGFEEREAMQRGTSAQQREGVIPVVEEELQVGKREVQTGGVRVYSHIVETPVQEEISLREEHATIERRPVDRPATEAERDAFKERSFEIRETAEQPVISKQARVKEEVTVGTEASERTEVVRETLRRTDVEVEKLDEPYGQQERVSAMDDEEFERHFRLTYGQRGERFEETYRSAYHFAEAESSSHPQLLNKDWPEVEEDIHRDWERSHPGTWNKVEEAIHFGWNKTRRH